jgi:hypothetical protein
MAFLIEEIMGDLKGNFEFVVDLSRIYHQTSLNSFLFLNL